MTFVSFFSGIGCFDLGLIRAGWERAGACEIDPFARKVYAARLGAPAFFPEDIHAVEAKDIPEANLWVGGSPCQGFSQAGKRGGLTDDRSNLALRWFDLARERRPRFLLLENVPGLLSGRTDLGEVERDEVGEPAGDPLWFSALLGALAECGYDATWRVLDARFFGVPQRRRRIFLLATRDPRDGPIARSVLFEPEGVRGRAPARREAGTCVAGGAPDGARGGGGGPDDNHAQAGHMIAGTVSAKWAKGTGGPSGDECQNLVASTLSRSTGYHGHSSPRGDGTDNLVVAIDEARARGANVPERPWTPGDAVPHIPAIDGPIPFDMAQVTSAANRSRCDPGSPAPTLHQGGGAHVARRDGMVRRLSPLEAELLQGLPGGWTCTCGLVPAGAPVPDHAGPRTAYPGYSTATCRCKDGPRYRAIGNGGAVPVLEWIGRRLIEALS